MLATGSSLIILIYNLLLLIIKPVEVGEKRQNNGVKAAWKPVKKCAQNRGKTAVKNLLD
jgi:hypothetical protein